ncbi:MAG: ATP-dependent RecD-like DNA helicase [Elusimicrobia bacterium HGW-Elusimicrobia-2]|nr:MAG: ATP-dependent RecD-like DNA helicase [Elusimicrobia bacterium HGW-Elusimicrobia-2]
MNNAPDKAQLNFDFLTDREKNYAEVSGEIKNIIYANPDTGWKVAQVLTATKKEAKICGYLPGIKTGDMIHARCTKTSHPQFGESLQIDEFYRELPYHKEGVIKFMMSCIDGVGEQMAERIVKKFKDKALEILEENSERLLEVEGVSEKLLEKIKKSSSSINTSVKELILIGFSPKWASRIYLKYGAEAASLIKKRPYRLIRDFKGIGFKKAEIIAGNVGVGKMDSERIAAGIYFSINTILQKTGHNFLYLNEVVRSASRLLEIPRAWAESETLSNKGLVIENDMVYLPRYYEAENAVAERIAEKIKLPVFEVKNFYDLIKEIESDVKINFSPDQIEAVKRALENPITVITGAAGTGKSTLCVGLLALLDKLGKTYALCAPTGKAANKIENLTGKRASTIHRLFKYSPAEGFRVNCEEPLEKDYLIVDEASMVDILLLQALCEGAGKNTRIVFIGDPYQLPPVDAGNSLQALVGSYSISQIMLPEVFRQKKESTILKNASMINMEKAFPMTNADDFEFIDTGSPEEMIKALYSSIDKLTKAGYHPIKDINILTPLNKGGGDISVSNLNIRLRDWLNPASEETSFLVHDREFRIGDKVMQRKNDYDLDIYNGDIGIITDDTHSENRVTVDFDGKEKSIPYSRMDNITLNYAMTVHKAQGSESRAVIFLATRSGCYFLLNKNLFYTAITRAREKLIMIMPYEVVKMAVGYNIRRQSFLSRRIQKRVLGREKN